MSELPSLSWISLCTSVPCIHRRASCESRSSGNAQASPHSRAMGTGVAGRDCKYGCHLDATPFKLWEYCSSRYIILTKPKDGVHFGIQG